MDWRKLEITLEQLVEVWQEVYCEDMQEDHPIVILKLVEVALPK